MAVRAILLEDDQAVGRLRGQCEGGQIPGEHVFTCGTAGSATVRSDEQLCRQLADRLILVLDEHVAAGRFDVGQRQFVAAGPFEQRQRSFFAREQSFESNSPNVRGERIESRKELAGNADIRIIRERPHCGNLNRFRLVGADQRQKRLARRFGRGTARDFNSPQLPPLVACGVGGEEPGRVQFRQQPGTDGRFGSPVCQSAAGPFKSSPQLDEDLVDGRFIGDRAGRQRLERATHVGFAIPHTD